MARMIFSLVWAFGATVIAIGVYRQESSDGIDPVALLFAVVFPAAGLFFVWDSWRRLRRRRSLRQVEDNGTMFYVWLEFDGTERRSTRDPRDDWDDADGDGDGGGD